MTFCVFAIHTLAAWEVATGSRSLILCLVRPMRAFVLLAMIAIFACDGLARPPRLSWSSELPKEVVTGTRAKHRTAREVDAFFARSLRACERVTIRTLIGAFGDPDQFTPEGYEAGGTLRWLLKDGGDLQVVTDETLREVFYASRFDSKGRNKFLSK